jgi:hypothetical protein
LRGGWTSLLRWVAKDGMAADREETPPSKKAARYCQLPTLRIENLGLQRRIKSRQPP